MATTPRGFRDILPDEAEMREHIVATVKARLVHHGYRPIETPLIESASVGGANAWSSDAPFNLFDDNGALLAVRPDNTTSVVHAIAARMSERDLPLRLRYEAPVVRQQPRGTAQARQFTQLGYELVGEGGDAADAEMTLIAAEALDDLGLNSWQLVCGSVVPYQALLELGVDEALANEALALVHANNYIDLDELAVTSDLPVALQCAMRELPRITGGPEALDRVDALLRAAGSTTSTTTELRSLVQRLTSCNAELASHLSFDFSLMSSFGYYTGLVLKAYAGDLADPVGSGGRYDAVLDAALEQGAAAAGFAFSLERLTEVLEAQAEQAPCGDNRVGESAGTVRPGSAATTNPSASATVGEQAPLRIAVPKDDTIAALEAVGIDASGLRDPGRHLIIRTRDTREGEGALGPVELVIVRATDAPAFVALGGTDCGICGRDSLIEADLDLLQLVDLAYGTCRFIEAEPAGRAEATKRSYARRGCLRVATKYPRIASAWYEERGVNAEVVALHGNIELGPIVGLADRIVDITATGTTLRENDLVITGELMTCTARFFANPGRARLDPRVRELARRLAAWRDESACDDAH
ncbi:MAG: ATP phosphoribosyltransferase [Collinsella stercoris]|uniref:ATP phosphoribosyltransferase n=1 Tax=Collinsella stercoris TaxID=147206 RepID=UPI003993E80C